MNTPSTSNAMEAQLDHASVATAPPLPLLAGALTVPGLLPRAPLDALLAEPERYSFFQAARLLYRAHGLPPRAGGSLANDTLRFTVPATLNFPPCELLTLDRTVHDDEHAPPRYTMSVNFLGLSGPSGVLPRHYTEWLLALQKSRDHATRDFLDIFNHRLVGLFWRAWAKHRTELAQELAKERSGSGVLRHVYDLIGLGTPALHALVEPRPGVARTRLPAAALGYYSGLVAQHPHGVGALAQVVGDVVDAPVEVISCHGTWQRIPPRDRTRLGRHNQRFGDGCVLGKRFWDRQTTVRVRIGPMRLRGFEALLPQRGLLEAVVELLRFLTGLALDLEIQLVLRAEAVPRARLGGAKPARLGWNSWLAGRRSEQPADECRFIFSGLA